MRAEVNGDRITLQTFIARVKKAKEESCSDLVGWRHEWDGICEDHWQFDFCPEQALDAIEISEGVADEEDGGIRWHQETDHVC